MESEKAILALAALAQSTRLDVFRLLTKHEPDGLAAGDIAKALAVPQNTMSSHLAILSRAGLVTARRISRSIVYRADLKAFQAVVLFMLRDCCDGRPEICAPVIEEPHALLPTKDKEESTCLIASTTSLPVHRKYRAFDPGGIDPAQGWSPQLRAFSAGSQPKGTVNPFAIKVLDRLDYPTDDLRSKSWEEFARAMHP